MSAFVVPREPELDRNFPAEFEELLRTGAVNAVNHGEFEGAVNNLIEQARTVDKGRIRASSLAIQRCRRGGKTFMLHAVASMLVEDPRLQAETRVLFISMNSMTPYSPEEDAYTAILSRIAWELSGRKQTFIRFKYKYCDFGEVNEWLTSKDNRVILIVDELNMIHYTAARYYDMSALLDLFVQRDGCALLYSTHHRGTADLLRGRRPGGAGLTLSKRMHKWISIPRIVNEKCLHGLVQDPAEQPSFWCAVLRGRVPALLLQTPANISTYAAGVFEKSNSEEDRTACLAAVITGEIDSLPNARNLFRAYSYRSERFTNEEGDALFAWPIFMVAQGAVLGRDYRRLRVTLENPDIDEPKAFEAVVQLAVLVRLLSGQEHALVPPNLETCKAGSAFKATEMFHVSESMTTMEDIIQAVSARYSRAPYVLQVVAVPMYASFPTYDFFLLHKGGEGWKVAAGYQCKQGTENPSEDAWTEIPLSVWIEGKCRNYRVQEDGKRVSEKLHRGWVLLGESNQVDLLGVSVSEALPHGPACEQNPYCSAEKAWSEQMEAAASEKRAKKARTSKS